MNNAVNNPKTLSRLWAALSCDFERLLTMYMSNKGWRYPHFAAVCRKMQITLILHVTQGRGKTKDEHYLRIMDVILQMCKDLWLCAFNSVNHLDRSNEDRCMELKRGLGGFYLLYTMYEKQPIPDRVKISLDRSDMVAFNTFCKAVRQIPWSREIFFMLHTLDYKEAFYHCIYADEYRFDAATRNFFNVSRGEVVKLTRRMRDSQDVLAYSEVHNRSEQDFADLTKVKHCLAKDMLKTLNKESLAKHFNNQSAFSLFVRTISSYSLHDAMEKLDRLLDKPVMTLQGLTATEAADRRITVETRRRMERARKKSHLATEGDREQKAARPYVREGGIFGRKKETQEGDDKAKRRERGVCYGNLWVFINGHDFDEPLGVSGSPKGGEEPQGGGEDENFSSQEDVDEVMNDIKDEDFEMEGDDSAVEFIH